MNRLPSSATRQILLSQRFSTNTGDPLLLCREVCPELNVNTRLLRRMLLSLEAVRKWSHDLYARPFTLITDQQSLACMFDQT